MHSIVVLDYFRLTGAFRGSMQHEPDEEVSSGSDVARV